MKDIENTLKVLSRGRSRTSIKAWMRYTEGGQMDLDLESSLGLPEGFIEDPVRSIFKLDSESRTARAFEDWVMRRGSPRGMSTKEILAHFWKPIYQFVSEYLSPRAIMDTFNRALSKHESMIDVYYTVDPFFLVPHYPIDASRSWCEIPLAARLYDVTCVIAEPYAIRPAKSEHTLTTMLRFFFAKYHIRDPMSLPECLLRKCVRCDRRFYNYLSGNRDMLTDRGRYVLLDSIS